MCFVFIICFLVILYSDDYMFGDLNIVWFIMLVLMFVVSVMFLIIRSNIIRILLGWDGLGLLSYFWLKHVALNWLIVIQISCVGSFQSFIIVCNTMGCLIQNSVD
jgi:NADH:ubiquinone oxidoreductase subunit 5 (subunit L)/multisubunit Na+/H+ antiporter MnhA subunit